MRDIKDYTDKYVDEPFEPTIVEIRKRAVIEQCNKYGHDNILEIGCGMDPFFKNFKDFKKMIIVEPGEAFAENARKLAESETEYIEVVSGFLEERIDTIKAYDIEFDYIILSSLLHELDEPQKMLNAIRKLCSKKTIVHINVPNANSMHRLIAIEAGLITDIHEQSEQMKRMQRRRTYDMNLLQDEIKGAGFTVVDSGSYFIKPFTHAQMQRCLDEGIIDSNVILGLERLAKYMPKFGAGIYVNVKMK